MSRIRQDRTRQKVLLFGFVLMVVLLLCWTLFNQSRWQAPAPRIPDYRIALEGLGTPGHLHLQDSDILLEHPLFEHDRSPPESKPEEVVPDEPVAEEPQAVPDTLDKVQLFGLYENAGGGVIIVRVDGKSRRVRVGEELEGWMVQRIEGRNVVFGREGSEDRSLELKRGTAPPPAPAAAMTPAARRAAAAQRGQQGR